MINVFSTSGFRRPGNFFDIIKSAVVMCGVRLAKPIPVFKMPQFDSEHSSLDSVHSAIPSHHRVMILASLTVIPKDPNLILQIGVVSYNRTRLAESPEILAG